jgi:hypothetical protein
VSSSPDAPFANALLMIAEISMLMVDISWLLIACCILVFQVMLYLFSLFLQFFPYLHFLSLHILYTYSKPSNTLPLDHIDLSYDSSYTYSWSLLWYYLWHSIDGLSPILNPLRPLLGRSSGQYIRLLTCTYPVLPEYSIQLTTQLSLGLFTNLWVLLATLWLYSDWVTQGIPSYLPDISQYPLHTT